MYYFNHGKVLSNTIRVLGYPSRITLRAWIDEISPNSKKNCHVSNYTVRYSNEKRKQAVFDLCERDGSADKIAKAHGVPRSTLYEWKKKMLYTENTELMSKKRNQKQD